MQRLINWVLAIGALVGLFYGIGLIVPRTTTRKAHAVLETPPERLYATITDVENWPKWNPDVASARQTSGSREQQVFDLSLRDGRATRLSVTGADGESTWSASYELDGTVMRMTYVFGWAGERGRIYLTRHADTRDPWRRARLFLWDREASKPVAILDALAQHLGEAPSASE